MGETTSHSVEARIGRAAGKGKTIEDSSPNNQYPRKEAGQG
jgi:hypothetical protein